MKRKKSRTKFRKDLDEESIKRLLDQFTADGTDFESEWSIARRFLGLVARKLEEHDGQIISSEQMIGWCMADAKGDLDLLYPSKVLDRQAYVAVMTFIGLIEKYAPPELVRVIKPE